MNPPGVRSDVSLLTEDDLHLFNEGTHLALHEKLGAHLLAVDGRAGVYFAVWAPNAAAVSVRGDFNRWDATSHPLSQRGVSGIWEGWIQDLPQGSLYKFHIRSRHRRYRVDKADPFGFRHEAPPDTASIVWNLDYEWGDGEWMASRLARNALDAPVSIYEVHLGSWRRAPEDGRRWLSYRQIAEPLAEYVIQSGFTHVEFMPLAEHPFYGSWGYQPTGYFAPTARYGTPQDLMYLIDFLHQRGIGVLLDWVPSHFPGDEHGLAYFDGTHLYEHANPLQGFHPDWKTYLFNYGRHEVVSFLASNALFWLDRYHVDGLRVDAVASMLYLDYSRKPGEWVPNRHGGRENLEAIAFLRRLNEAVYSKHPDAQTVAEESTAWPLVSRPTHLGGLGFGMKWDMGWMHDALEYFSHDPIHRRFYHGGLTFRFVYAFRENFVLPLSHDEVVYGKRSLLGKMPGDDWQKRANLRLLLATLYAEPGKKLLFMGGEFGQPGEWNHDAPLDWHLLADERHRGIRRWIEDLNRLYRGEPALHTLDCDPNGFEWVDANDADQSVFSFIRKGTGGARPILVVLNATPVVRRNYRAGVPCGGFWREVLNGDAPEYGGSGQGNLGGVEAAPLPGHGREWSLSLTLPPLAAIFLRCDG